jgi:hypothetical protein
MIWLVDGKGAPSNKPGTDAGDLAGPQTSMRYMNSSQKASTLAARAPGGGWLAGRRLRSMINFNRGLATTPAPATLTFRTATTVIAAIHLRAGALAPEFKYLAHNGKLKHLRVRV